MNYFKAVVENESAFTIEQLEALSRSPMPIPVTVEFDMESDLGIVTKLYRERGNLIAEGCLFRECSHSHIVIGFECDSMRIFALGATNNPQNPLLPSALYYESAYHWLHEPSGEVGIALTRKELDEYLAEPLTREISQSEFIQVMQKTL